MIQAALSSALLLLVAFSTSLSAQVDPSYGVQAGDKLILDFFTAAGVRSSEIAGERTVDRNGEIFLPLLGTISVLGKSAQEIRLQLLDRYSVIFDEPVLQVAAQLRINVTGFVRSPGSYYVDPSLTVLDALAEAGGATGEVDLGTGGGAADAAQVRLVRRNGELRVLDLRPDFITRETRNLRIQSGDWIRVPPQNQSRMRDEIQFYGGLLSILATVVSLIVISTN